MRCEKLAVDAGGPPSSFSAPFFATSLLVDFESKSLELVQLALRELHSHCKLPAERDAPSADRAAQWRALKMRKFWHFPLRSRRNLG